MPQPVERCVDHLVTHLIRLLERFTKEAVRLGVPAVATFEAPALLEAADMNAVVLCINALERLRLGQFTPRCSRTECSQQDESHVT